MLHWCQNRQVGDLEAAQTELDKRLRAQTEQLAAHDARLADVLRQLSLAKALLQAKQR